MLKLGERDAGIVGAVKRRLNKRLHLATSAAGRLDASDPAFDRRTKDAVRLFQSQNVDAAGRPLRPDGALGPLTWAVLFASQTALPPVPASGFLGEVIRIASMEVAANVREVPPDSNHGPRVEQYLASVGLGGGHPWCCAFVHWCFESAARRAGRPNPMVRTAGCLDHWKRAEPNGATRIVARSAHADASVLRPGMVHIMDYGGGLGHTGLVESVGEGLITTIEGNTNASRTREGGGVYRLTRRIGEVNRGFIDYSRVG